MSLISRLIALGQIEKITDNTLNNYLPIRSKNNAIAYSSVSGNVLGMLIGRELDPKRYSFNEFKEECLDELGGLLTDEAMLDHIEQMYFRNDALNSASPEFLLLGCLGSETAASKNLSRIFRSFLAQAGRHSELKSKANFIEQIFINVLQNYLTKPGGKDVSKEKIEHPYLPFMTEAFVKDIHFLSSKTQYLLSHFEDFLQLYNFLYCSQLALNIRNWANGVPKSQPLYFILDTEKANTERSLIQNNGYSALYRSFGVVFPILSMLDNFNKQGDGNVFPLWSYSEALNAEQYDADEVSAILEEYAEKFRRKRLIKQRLAEDDSPISQMRLLIAYSLDQFEKSRSLVTLSKHKIRDDYQKQFEEHIAKHFMQVRGRSGRVLVMNQDYLLLLTNIAIGSKRQLRFQELLKEFRARGVYFDKQSEQVLIAFFERVGNVDRMSDSGDAVYVRSTI
ncbi:DNA phosphorothioation-dependent restriction protein DptG [Endozoicomonas sp. ALC020]|uniref:DNA phosphorothioation-dependent restriction protein DptG n=1 Tax=unclassified Endozoicomonas TaxID=2644528 RepID=UPI003BB2174C